MKTRGLWFWRQAVAIFGFIMGLLLSTTAHAQLAITEMMSSALRTNGVIISTNNSDFFELTNYGSNTVNLAGYTFTDASHGNAGLLIPTTDPELFIHAGESVVFVRNDITKTVAQFRSWWGSCVGPEVQIRFYKKPGFSSYGDGIRLYAPDGTLVDSVDFPAAHRGVSFVSDTNTGAFGTLSVLNQGHACQAATAMDVASPGTTTGPIPLTIVQQPANVSVCLGVTTAFAVSAAGLPRPRYRWFFNGAPIPGANQDSYTVLNPTMASAGAYSVVVSNGLTTLQSSNAMLSVRTDPAPPTFITPPVNVTAVTNRSARFSASICAYPQPTYQWFSNGVAMAGATNQALLIPNCKIEMSGTEYCLGVQNSQGSNFACAFLFVVIKPPLRFTELQAYPFTDCDAHHDWFEITNFHTNAVDLFHFRFSDAFSLTNAVVITQSMILLPNESAIFVKSPSPEIFFDWWGANQLPDGLKVYSYGGFSLSKAGDTLYLWNGLAEGADEAIDAIQYATNVIGRSMRFDAGDCFFGCDSVAGEAGAFRAAQCGDVGSPGYTTDPPLRLLGITRDASGAYVKWRAIEGKIYQLEFNGLPQPNGWTGLTSMTATSAVLTMADPSATNASQRFYRIKQLTP